MVLPFCLWALVPPLLLLGNGYAAPTDNLPSAADFYVQHLPDLHQDESHPLHIYAGHLPSDPNASSPASTEVTPHLYFVMVKARRTADKERVMFWFNGGPGCSSFDGLMMEIGPWRVDGNGGYKTVEGGWEEYTNMIYVDQPVGTGFSYTSTDHYVHELSEASEQFIEFLRNFYHVFPEYSKMDTYLGGESFAGQYIPYFADYIINSDLHVPLRGAAIGNGWIDGRHQYPSYLEYAVKHGLVEEGSEDYKHGKAVTDACIQDFESKSTEMVPLKTSLCESVMQEVVAGKNRVVDGRPMCLNIYDVRLEDESPACGMNWPTDLVEIKKYLGRKDVVNALHANAKSESWVECKGSVSSAFRARNSPSSITIVPKVLERIPMLLFAGDQDLICNYVGIENTIQSMTWNGATGLGTVETQSWQVNDVPAGTWVTSRNLTYVKIFNASHMVPYDLPHVAHDMILRFMGVNFAALTGGSAKIPSSLGTEKKPMPTLLDEQPAPPPVTGKTPEQDKAMWEAYYNAGSAALVLVIIAVLIGAFVWWRSRKNRLQLPFTRVPEESIPLNQTNLGRNGDEEEEENFSRLGKGKARAESLTPSEVIFGVGDDDDDDDSKSPRSHRS